MDVSKFIVTIISKNIQETVNNREVTYYEKNRQRILEKYHRNKVDRLKYQIEYNHNHKDELKERNKNYYLSHREKMIDKANRYKELNKDKLCEKIICECGGKFLFVGKSKHLLTKKHISFVEKKWLTKNE